MINNYLKFSKMTNTIQSIKYYQQKLAKYLRRGQGLDQLFRVSGKELNCLLVLCFFFLPIFSLANDLANLLFDQRTIECCAGFYYCFGQTFFVSLMLRILCSPNWEKKRTRIFQLTSDIFLSRCWVCFHFLVVYVSIYKFHNL